MLSLLFLLSTTTAQFEPPTGGTLPPFEFSATALPRICIECCIDVMFVLDRSTSIRGPTGSALIHWRRMKAIIADLAAGPFNDPKVRVGALQMGDSTTINPTQAAAGSGGTGPRFYLTSGPFNDQDLQSWGESDTFSSGDTSDWKLASEIALANFNSEQPNVEVGCTVDNLVRLIIWIVDNGPSSNSLDPCTQPSPGPTLVQQMRAARIAHHIVGFGSAWSGGGSAGRQCMFSAGADFSLVIKELASAEELQTKTVEAFSVDPCNRCEGELDLVIVMDESGSLCNGETALQSGICPERDEWDRQIDFVSRLIAELAATWENNRVALWSMGTTVRNHFKLGWTGAPSASTNPDGSPTFALTGSNIWSEAKVQLYLQGLKNDFKEGVTAQALAWTEAIGEIEFAPPRLDGKTPKRVIMFMTDGGPNPPYYVVNGDGDRVTTGCTLTGSQGFCINEGYKKFWDGTTNSAGPGQMNMAICTDAGDPNPVWVRYRKTSNGHERFLDTPKGYDDAMATLQITPIVVLVGQRRDKHEKDVDCMIRKVQTGGLVTPASFDLLASSAVYRAAIRDSICTDVPLGTSSNRLVGANIPVTDIFARWDQFVAFKQQQQFKQFKQWQAAQQQTFVKQEVSSTNYAMGAALMIGVAFGSFLVGKNTRRPYDYQTITDQSMV